MRRVSEPPVRFSRQEWLFTPLSLLASPRQLVRETSLIGRPWPNTLCMVRKTARPVGKQKLLGASLTRYLRSVLGETTTVESMEDLVLWLRGTMLGLEMATSAGPTLQLLEGMGLFWLARPR